MAKISELLEQVEDKALRARLQEEFDRLSKTKKFGLVFEDHIPECTPLYGIAIKIGSNVAKKAGQIKDVYTVVSIDGTMAKCYHKPTKETVEISLEELVPVAQFGEPIFPMLQPIDSIQNAPDSGLWHTLIEADNYHALQLLEYLYAGKVDCIYIDPPYNTGARDWKYNNDYVDGSDSYRHSKWLSMMEKRLKIARRLLNPDDSVLIVTIDEKEYLHLGCLLEEMFPEASMQMISSVINPYGTQRLNEFSRNDEYIFFLMFGSARPAGVQATEDAAGQSFWKTFRRGDLASRRGQPKGGKAQFYPIYVNVSNGIIESIGDPILPGVDRSTVLSRPGCMAVFPLRDDGTEMNWCTRKEAAEKRLSNGYIKAGGFNPRTEQKYPILYLRSGTIDDITAGKLIVDGYAEDHSIIAHYAVLKDQMPQTNWHIKEHSARDYGSNLLRSIFIEKRFIFPKSLYAVHDCIKLFVKHKKDALIVDFFAGSGTTLHAVNLLNAEDGGERRCIMVTNNEVSEAEAKSLQAQGYHPGDTEWERLGIARYVTWPRTQCTIKGENVKGQPLKGEYIGSEIPMADGFATNAEYFKLGFLDRDRVSLGQQFKEILPLLWLKAGAVGKRPEVEDAEPDMLILPENGFAVLVDEIMYASFLQQVKQHTGIKMIFFVTDSEEAFREMSAGVTGCETFQLYRDYIDNFVLGSRRA